MLYWLRPALDLSSLGHVLGSGEEGARGLWAASVQVGASNELPESEELDALYDRFLIRKSVCQVSKSGLLEMLSSGGAGGKQVGRHSMTVPARSRAAHSRGAARSGACPCPCPATAQTV